MPATPKHHARRSPSMAGVAAAVAFAALIGGCGQDSQEPVTTASISDADQTEHDQSDQTEPDASSAGPWITWASTAPAAGTRVSLEVLALPDGETADIRILLHEFADLHGIAGQLRFDPKVVEVQEVIAGQLPTKILDAAELRGRVLARATPAGRLLLGATVFGKPHASAVFAQGIALPTWLWATVRVALHTAGATTVDFDPERNLALDPQRGNIAVHWDATTLTVLEVPR